MGTLAFALTRPTSCPERLFHYQTGDIYEVDDVPAVAGYKHHTRFNIGNVVYLKMDRDGVGAVVTAIIIKPKGAVNYELAWGDATTTEHCEIELCTTPNIPPEGKLD